ncbi:hypothetical protein DSM100688_0950 [Bifidobacterium ramosum]|uniref:Uncharacterized protein n=1 Tax=Bifidobacterium ramosum TaxID=1798158 RepID=A0A6L4X218_9BIFI|nr:hypothetical protein [Bifidobacterium ramosum]KAB8288383.1 hypothetical protein DSM100688_0950 [Bifidobacterium ramosum]NEG71581.1 hypothetical protein [Bifidobacterium ramosum]
MTFSIDEYDVERIAALPSVRAAAEAGARLVALWPLTDAKQMDNDAKYAENLQVRLARTIARVATGEDVTMPDAEFVYEGADEIPGRPQSIVDALLAANDAYDTMVGYRDAHDPSVLFDAASAMGVEWPAATADGLREAVTVIERTLGDGAGVAGDGADDVAADGDGVTGGAVDDSSAADGVPGGVTDTTDDDSATRAVDGLTRRFAESLVICDGLLSIVEQSGVGADDTTAAAVAQLPIVLFVNELREQTAVPRICLTDDQYRTLLAARADAGDAGTTVATTGVIAPIAEAEWARHYDDVTWDPDEAKRRAKEEDERKNKEALAAKFAHVKDDPTKPEVEL